MRFLQLGVRAPFRATLGRRLRLGLRGAKRALPACNAANGGEAPRMPSGFKTEVDKKGWRH
jgi:hypothetical protein